MSSNPQPIVRFASVSFLHGRLPAVRDVTLTIEAGTSVAFLGPNGSGKSTMLDLMAGLKTPTAGSLEVAAAPHRISYVLQRLESRQALPVTVDEVLRMGRYGHRGLTGRLRAADHDAIDRAADRSEINDLRLTSRADDGGDAISPGRRQHDVGGAKHAGAEWTAEEDVRRP